jgi:hypothetical protein
MRWVALAALTGIAAAPTVGLGGEVRTQVRGLFNNSQENACIHVSKFFYLTDCMYTWSDFKVGGNSLPWTGPTVNPVYFSRESPHAVPTYVPVAGDDRIAPTMEGMLAIDDHGTRDLGDDTISGTLVVGPAARTVVANVNELAGGPGGPPPRAVISWSSITHTLAPTRVTTAERDAKGDIVYVIASKGFPERLCRKADPADCFPSARAPKTNDGPNNPQWDHPSKIGLTRESAIDSNVGASTAAVMADYTCVDNRGGVVCPQHNVVWRNSREPAPGERNLSEAPGFDNLLLRIRADSGRRIRSVEGFWTQEYSLEAGPADLNVPEGHDNSWQGGFLQLTGDASSRATP